MLSFNMASSYILHLVNLTIMTPSLLQFNPHPSWNLAKPSIPPYISHGLQLSALWQNTWQKPSRIYFNSNMMIQPIMTIGAQGCSSYHVWSKKEEKDESWVSAFLLFLFSPGSCPMEWWDKHSTGTFHLSEASLETAPQIHPEVCLLAVFQYCQVDAW